jgi:hypothetical protein
VNLYRPILHPQQKWRDDGYDKMADYSICFIDVATGVPLSPIEPRTASYILPNYVPIDLSTMVAKIRFTTANGVRWETPTKGMGSGEPVRL